MLRSGHSLVAQTILLALVFYGAEGMHAAEAGTEGAKRDELAGVRVMVTSQRWLTDQEVKELQDAYDDVVWNPPVGKIRVRFVNEGERDILFLTAVVALDPLGYYLHRAPGAVEWKANSPSRGREGPPCSEFNGGSYMWLRLSPCMAIEWEDIPIGEPEEEHARSVCVKSVRGGKPVEIISEPYKLPPIAPVKQPEADNSGKKNK